MQNKKYFNQNLLQKLEKFVDLYRKSLKLKMGGVDILNGKEAF